MEIPGSPRTQVAAAVRSFRTMHGWSLQDLAERLAKRGHPLGVNTLSKIENGNRNVDVDDLVAFADVLGTSTSVLLTSEQPAAERVRARIADVAMAEAGAHAALMHLDDTIRAAKLEVLGAPGSQHILEKAAKNAVGPEVFEELMGYDLSDVQEQVDGPVDPVQVDLGGASYSVIQERMILECGDELGREFLVKADADRAWRCYVEAAPWRSESATSGQRFMYHRASGRLARERVMGALPDIISKPPTSAGDPSTTALHVTLDADSVLEAMADDERRRHEEAKRE